MSTLSLVCTADAFWLLLQAVCFSPDCCRLASISLDNNHTLTLWDWRAGSRLLEQRTQPGAPPAVYGVVWSEFEPDKLATYGQNHVRWAGQGTCT